MFQALKSFCTTPLRAFEKKPHQEIHDAIAEAARIDPRYANELRAVLWRHEEDALVGSPRS